jgi:DNA polymerase elongation subunit (family B)
MNRLALIKTTTTAAPRQIIFVTDIRDHHHKNGRNLEYVLVIYGVLENGEKAVCFVKGIKPYIDIKIADKDFVQYLNTIEYGLLRGTPNKRVTLTPFIGYAAKQQYIRYYFESCFSRKKVLEFLATNKYKGNPIEFASDDTVYYRKVIREAKLQPCAWIELTRVFPKQDYVSMVNADLCKNVYVTELNFIKPVEIEAAPPVLELDWDIETYSDEDGVPQHDDSSSVIFMISCTLYWMIEQTPIRKYVLSTMQTPEASSVEASDAPQYIHFRNEKLLIAGFLKLILSYGPELVVGFNDSGYDWPFIFAKIRQHKLENEIRRLHPLDIYTKNIYQLDTKIKLEGMLMAISVPSIHNMLPIDVRTYCRKNIISDQSSLNFYLHYYNLPVKVDLKISRMRELYRLNDPLEPDTEKLFNYCLVDSERCHDLMLKLNIALSIFETANLVYVNARDVFYYANGIKVRNLIMGEGADKFAFCCAGGNSVVGPKKYPGAYVITPEPRLYKYDGDLPVSCVDVSSLYPNVMITYNISPENILFDKDVEFDNQRYYLKEINFDHDGEPIVAWCMRYKDTQDMGLVPRVLLFLYNLRLEKKKLFEKFEALKELYDTGKLTSLPGVPDNQLQSHITFNYNYYNVKQLAIKVLMNTFYGEFGCQTSPFFMVQLAGAVTTFGRVILHNIKDYLQDKENCYVVYGDTDSVYFNLSRDLYQEIIRQYKANEIDKPQYWENLINTTIVNTKQLQQRINAMLREKTKHSFVKVAYEDCLFPAFFLGKKNYIGKKHIHEANMNAIMSDDMENNNALLLKGITIKKRGIDKYTQYFSFKMIGRLLSIEETPMTYVQIIEDILQNINYEQLDMSYYIKNAMCKRSTSHTYEFIEKISKNTAPPIGDRFLYYIKKTSEINVRGFAKAKRMSDRMELYDENNPDMPPPDRTYYNESVYSIAAKFLINSKEYSGNTKQIKDKLIKRFSKVEADQRQKDIFKQFIMPRLIQYKIVDCRCLNDIIKLVDSNNMEIISYITDRHKLVLKAIDDIPLYEKNVPDSIIQVLNSIFNHPRYKPKSNFKKTLQNVKITCTQADMRRYILKNDL